MGIAVRPLHLLRAFLALISFCIIPVPHAVTQESRPAAVPFQKIIVPPPAREEFNARPAPDAMHMDVVEAREKMGWIPALSKRKLGGFEYLKIAIIDIGFGGINEWLEKNPGEKKRTVDVSASQFANDPGGDHGFKVYRVTRQVLLDVTILLYDARASGGILAALEDAARRGAVIANVSLLRNHLFEIVEQDSSFAESLHALLSRLEMFVFFAIGNERDETHSWISTDRNKNGYVDFAETADTRKDVDSTGFILREGQNRIFFTWDSAKHPNADYELELLDSSGKIQAKARASQDSKKGMIDLSHNAARRMEAIVRIKRLAGPAEGVFMRLNTFRLATRPGHFNGLQTARTYILRDHPFLIFVGSVGKTKEGTLSVSDFSDIGTGPDGKLYPHVLGPGQILLDDKKVQGTSFASPFIAAVYGIAAGYNLKNLIERNASHKLIDNMVKPHERSRWGTPDVMKMFGADQVRKNVTGPTKIENISHKAEGGDLVIRFNITRCCMEAMTWWVVVDFLDAEGKQLVSDPATGKAVIGAAMLKSDKADYARHPLEIRIPVKSLEQAKGKKLELRFSHVVRTWREYYENFKLLNFYKIDEVPSYSLTL